MLRRHRANEFLNDDCLAYACAAEHANFAAFRKRSNQVDHFHAGFKKLRRRHLIFKTRGRGGEWDSASRWSQVLRNQSFRQSR